MNTQEMVVFNRIAGFSVYEVTMTNNATRDDFTGTEVLVRRERAPQEIDFFFPDYAGMSNEEIAEVVANNLREELWNSLKES